MTSGGTSQRPLGNVASATHILDEIEFIIHYKPSLPLTYFTHSSFQVQYSSASFSHICLTIVTIGAVLGYAVISALGININ